MVYILGFSDSVHDRSVCIFEDNNPLVAIEEERLTRAKHGFTLYKESRRNPEVIYNLDLEESSSVANEDSLRDSIEYCLDSISIQLSDIDIFIGNSLHKYFPFRDKALHINHHLAHAASAYFPSGFEDALILVTDGYGDAVDNNIYETVSLYQGSENTIKRLESTTGKVQSYFDTENSLGVFYRIGTFLAGFGSFDAGKMMGLSAYGQPSYYDQVKQFIHYTEKSVKIENGRIWQSLSTQALKQDGQDFNADIASTFQRHLEEMILFYAKLGKMMTGSQKLCIAGGVGLNCVANSRLLQESEFDDIFIFPAAGDNGISMGSAYFAAHSILKLPRGQQLSHSYFGKTYSDAEITRAFRKVKSSISYKAFNDTETAHKAATLLAKGEIIMWFQGGCEFGPRALGHRSILANPTSVDTRDYINNAIKFREMFRPLAPIVLEDHLEEYFDTDRPSPFMLFSPVAKELCLQKAPAIIHEDNTARLQTLNKYQNNLLHDVIKNFNDLVSVPIILNTSFNGKDEPIVETPDEGIAAFLGSPLQHLFMNNFYVTKTSR